MEIEKKYICDSTGTPLTFSKNTYKQLFTILLNRYNRNIVANLTSEEEMYLDDVLNNLNDVFVKVFDNTIDKDRVKMIIKRMYVPNRISVGGSDVETQIIQRPRENRSTMAKITADFLSIVGLIVSILLLYAVYIKFNNLLCEVVGQDIDNVGQTTMNEIRSLITQMREEYASTENEGFLFFVFNAFYSFTNKVVLRNTEILTQSVVTAFSTIIETVKTQTQETCLGNIPKWDNVKTFMDGVGYVASMIGMSNADYWKTTLECSLETTRILTEQIISERTLTLRLLLNNLNVRTLELTNIMIFATRLFYTSSGYLIIRLGFITRDRIENLRTIRNGDVGEIELIEDVETDTSLELAPELEPEIGGRRKPTRKTRIKKKRTYSKKRRHHKSKKRVKKLKRN